MSLLASKNSVADRAQRNEDRADANAALSKPASDFGASFPRGFREQRFTARNGGGLISLSIQKGLRGTEATLHRLSGHAPNATSRKIILDHLTQGRLNTKASEIIALQEQLKEALEPFKANPQEISKLADAAQVSIQNLIHDGKGLHFGQSNDDGIRVGVKFSRIRNSLQLELFASKGQMVERFSTSMAPGPKDLLQLHSQLLEKGKAQARSRK